MKREDARACFFFFFTIFNTVSKHEEHALLSVSFRAIRIYRIQVRKSTFASLVADFH